MGCSNKRVGGSYFGGRGDVGCRFNLPLDWENISVKPY